MTLPSAMVGLDSITIFAVRSSLARSSWARSDATSTRFGTTRDVLGTSVGRMLIVTTQNSTEASSTASSATPAQIHATGGPDCVRVMVVSELS